MKSAMVPSTLVAATILAAWSSRTATPRPESAAIAACSTIGGTPRRLELFDGRIISIDVKSVAYSGGLVLAAGNFGYVFQKDVQAYEPPKDVDSILGVLVDDQQRVTAVPNPIAPTRIFHPRVVAAPNGSFHVLFASGLDTVTFVSPLDTVTLWYAMLHRGFWSRPQRVGKFAGAKLALELTSTLLERNGDLSFTFPFTDGRSMESLGGAIFLRRRVGGRWTADTLRTVNTPSVLKAAFDRDGSVVVLVGLAEDIPGRSKEKAFLARYDSRWTAPRYLAGDGIRPISNPRLFRLRDGFVVSWADWVWMNQPTSRLNWARVDNSLRLIQEQRIDSGEATHPFELVVVDSQFPLWLYHGDKLGELVSVAIGADSVFTKLPPIRAPFRSPIPSTLALPNNRFAVFTQVTALKPNEPLAASYMTTLEIRCPGPGRR